DVGRDEVHGAARSAEGMVQAALVTERTGIAGDRGSDPEGLAGDQVDHGSVAVNLHHAAHYAAGEYHGGADGEAIVGALADYHAGPPAAREVAKGDPRRLEAEVRHGGDVQQVFETEDLRFQMVIRLVDD